jgi:hypothetical protein
MQKITYINLRNEQIVFQYAPYVLEKHTGLSMMPDMEFETIKGVYQQGETTAGFRRPFRPVTVYFHLMAGTVKEMYQLRTRLQGILSPDRAMNGTERARLIYENDSGRWVTDAIPDGGLEPSKRIGSVQPELKVNFRCESPYLYATLEEETVFQYTGEGFTLPFEFPIEFGLNNFTKEVSNAGQVNAPVEVWIECKGETPKLINESTGAVLMLAGPVSTGNTLYINTDPARLEATITDAEGNVTGAFGRLSLDTSVADFFLRPGLNKLVYDTGGEIPQSVIRVRWRPAYEGV